MGPKHSSPSSADEFFSQVGTTLSSAGSTIQSGLETAGAAIEDTFTGQNEVGSTLESVFTTGTIDPTEDQSAIGDSYSPSITFDIPPVTYSYYIYSFPSTGNYQLLDDKYAITPTLPPIGCFYLQNGYFYDDITKGVFKYKKTKGSALVPIKKTITVNFDASVFIPLDSSNNSMTDISGAGGVTDTTGTMNVYLAPVMIVWGLVFYKA